MKFIPKELDGNVNVSATHPLKELAVLLGGLVAIALAAYMVLGLAVDWVLPYVPRSLELAIGERMGPFPTVSAKHEEFLQALAEALEADTPENPGAVRVAIMDMAEPDAFALPGGRILVSRGLLEKAGSENEVAMVLAHELGHEAHRDALRGMGRGLVLSMVASVFMNADDAVRYFLGSAMTLAQQGYSRGQERAADLYAVDTVLAHYGNGVGAVDFFKRIGENSEHDTPPEWLSTHPSPEHRVRYLTEIIESRASSRGAKPVQLPEWWGEWPEPTDEAGCGE